MFSNLRQGNQVFIVKKPDTLKIATVSNISTPYYLPNHTMGISVKYDGETVEFKQLPSQASVAYYDNGNTIVSDSRDVITTEVETMMKNSSELIKSVPYHEKIVTAGEDMLKILSPQFAQQKDQQEKINNLESKVGNMESKLDSIATMLTKALDK